MHPRLSVLTGVVAAGLLAGSCSSGGSTSAPLTAATFATLAPTTSPAPTTTAAPTSAPTTSAPATSTTEPASTAATTTSIAVTTTSSSAVATSTIAAAPVDWSPVAGPAVGDSTAPIDPNWIGPDGATLSELADGTYWGTVEGEGESPQRFIGFKISQAFFGSACTAKFGADSCDNDFATQEQPSGNFQLYLGTARITVADAATQQSYQITGEELYRLVGGAGPSAAAPAGFTYVPFAFLLTVSGGQIVSAEQVWTP